MNEIIWHVNEYTGDGICRSASFSTREKAVQAAGECCSHDNEVEIVEWTYCRPLSVQQIYPVEKERIVY